MTGGATSDGATRVASLSVVPGDATLASTPLVALLRLLTMEAEAVVMRLGRELASLANTCIDSHSLAMPTRNVNLPEHQDRFVGAAVLGGRYQNASEVVREGLRLLERRELEDEARMVRLRALIAVADAAVARGEYIDVDDADLDDWLAGLGAAHG